MRKLLMLVGILFLVGCETEENTFVVGLECDYTPYNWTVTEDFESDYKVQIEGSNQYCDGYDVQVAQAIADDLGLELVINKISWDGLPSALQAGQIDAIIAGMSPTSDRKQTMNFTNAYFTEESEQVVVVRTDSQFAQASSLSDFGGATIIAQLGTFQVDLISQLNDVEEGTHLQDYPSVINAVLAGTADGYVAELVVAQAQVANNSDLVLLRLSDGFTLDPAYNTVAVALRKEDTELLNSINEALENISEADRSNWMEEASVRAEG